MGGESVKKPCFSVFKPRSLLFWDSVRIVISPRERPTIDIGLRRGFVGAIVLGWFEGRFRGRRGGRNGACFGGVGIRGHYGT